MRRLLYAAVFGGLLVAGSSFALAQGGYVTLNSFSGFPGAELTVSGGGWQSGDTISIYFGATSGAPAATTTVIGGQFSTPAAVPKDALQGPLAVYAVDDATKDQAANSYYVEPLAPSITVSAPFNTPFSTILVSGAGFAAHEAVRLDVGGKAGTTTVANAGGSFTNALLTIPKLAAGLYLVNATGESSGARAVYYLWVNAFYPSAAPSAWYTTPGGTLSFSGKGFAPNEVIDVSNTGTVLSTTTTDASGSFSGGQLIVPLSLRNSTAAFSLTGEKSGASASVKITIGNLYPYATPSAWYLLPGSLLTFTGGGFGPSEAVDIFQNTTPTPVASFTTDASGTFVGTGTTTVPFSHGPSVTYTLLGTQSDVATQVAVALGAFYPTLTPSVYYSAPGGTISLAGKGFAPNETVQVESGAFATTTKANGLGNISVQSLPLPYIGNIELIVTAKGELSNASASVGVTLGSYYPLVSPSTYYAFPGSTITFSGTGFAPNETVSIGGAGSGSAAANNTGSFTSTTTIPFTAKGSATFTFLGSESHAFTSTVITLGTLNPYLSLSSYYAAPGQSVTAQGIGFAPSEGVSVSAGSFSTTTQANSSGTTPPVSIPISYSSTGFLTITMAGLSSGASASANVGVAKLYPSVAANSYYVLPGSRDTFSGEGFAPGEEVTASYDNTSTTTQVAKDGAFTLPLQMPKQNGGVVAVYFTSSLSGYDSSVSITMAKLAPGIWFSNYWGQGGTPLTVFGAGFEPNETVSLSTKEGPFATAVANASGDLNASTSIPFAPAGSLTVTATGQKSGATASATLTVAPVYVDFELGQYAGAPDSTIEFIGHGYLPNEPVAITTDRTGSTSIASFEADAGGSFDDKSFTTPSNWSEGPLTITARGLHSFSSKSIEYYVTGK